MSALFAGQSRALPARQASHYRLRVGPRPRPNLRAVPVLPVPWRYDDFQPAELAAAKADLGLTVSVCLPARNEEATVGHIVATVRRTLVEEVALVDEVLVIDDGSTDSTAAVAAWEGARVVAVADILTEAGPGSGKGNAMWKSLDAAEGDLLCWLDADIRNFGEHFVTGLLGPLLTEPEVGFVKGFYRRPLHDQPQGGGRVTELMARPLISTLFPQLGRFVQPLSGEYAGRREVLEALPFVEGWGVEFALLVDVIERFGISSTAQVDLGVREHRNRPLSELGAQATAILVTALRRAGLVSERPESTELLRYTDDFEPEALTIEVRERPPIESLPSYRTKHGRERTA
jgi:glucosyl-3-phosphoglycerate synthase